ncbi:hypothetical protein [Clostridium perfringens]|uniref:hypothetical protein n=1 Tax=Clostridium perfringens TaxID=1502 RepID=UPI0030CC305F
MSKKRKYHLTKEEYELYRLSNYEWNTLNTKISFYPTRKKASKVLFFLKKYIILNGGKYQKSTQSMYKIFKNSCKISHSKFKDILNQLEGLGLIGVIRDGLKTKTYFIPDNPENDQNDKPKLKKNLKFKDSDSGQSEDDLWSEFWNIVEKINKNYKGIEPEDIKFATKKQLYGIAKTLLATENFIGNKADYNNIQYLIFRKIRYSNQRINLVGAVQYIRKVINDQVQRYRNGELKVPFIIPVRQALVNFSQRDTDYNSIENELLGWT